MPGGKLIPRPLCHPKSSQPRRERSLTLIASLKCSDGLVLAADSEEVISEPPLLRTHKEKLRILQTAVMSTWTIVAGGAGEYDYIGMIGDLIEEKVSQLGAPDPGKVDNIIRSAVAEVWRDHARYEQRPIDVKILIASRSDDHPHPRLSVVSGAAIRRGSDVEAIGIGDATFKALMDRFIVHGVSSTILADSPAARVFMVYAMQQAKRSIPGIGGNTRIITMTDKGIEYMKLWAVAAIQRFFGGFDQRIRAGVQNLDYAPPGGDPIEYLLATISEGTLEDYRGLKQELKDIDANPALV